MKVTGKQHVGSHIEVALSTGSSTSHAGWTNNMRKDCRGHTEVITFRREIEQSGRVDGKIKSGLPENFYDKGWVKKLTTVRRDSLNIKLAYNLEWVNKWEEVA